jgi:hypothetical protein
VLWKLLLLFLAIGTGAVSGAFASDLQDGGDRPYDHMPRIAPGDLKGAAGKALGFIKPAEGMDAKTVSENPWAVSDDFIDRVVIECVNELTPK